MAEKEHKGKVGREINRTVSTDAAAANELIALGQVVGIVSAQNRTGNTILFDKKELIYNKDSPVNGNITLDFTGAVEGSCVMFFLNNNAEPTVANGIQKYALGRFTANRNNCWFFYYLGNNEYSLNKTVDKREQLATPENFTASSVSTTQTNTSWNPVTNATGYKLYASTANDFSTATEIYSGASTSYSHTGLTDGTTYYYWVTATAASYQASPYATTSQVAGNIPLLADDFEAASLDAAKFTIISEGADVDVAQQNGKLEFIDLTTKASGAAFSVVRSVSMWDANTVDLCLTFDMAKNPLNATFFAVGLRGISTSNLIYFETAGNNKIRTNRQLSGTPNTIEHNYSYNNKFKMYARNNAGTYTVEFYVYENNAWTLLTSGAFNPEDYQVQIYRGLSSVTGTVNSVDNLELTDYDQ